MRERRGRDPQTYTSGKGQLEVRGSFLRGRLYLLTYLLQPHEHFNVLWAVLTCLI